MGPTGTTYINFRRMMIFQHNNTALQESTSLNIDRVLIPGILRGLSFIDGLEFQKMYINSERGLSPERKGENHIGIIPYKLNHCVEYFRIQIFLFLSILIKGEGYYHFRDTTFNSITIPSRLFINEKLTSCGN